MSRADSCWLGTAVDVSDSNLITTLSVEGVVCADEEEEEVVAE